MNKRMVSVLLAALLALSACGKKVAPVSTETDVKEPEEAAVEETVPEVQDDDDEEDDEVIVSGGAETGDDEKEEPDEAEKADEKEESVQMVREFVSGESFSGVKRPTVVSDKQILPETGIDKAKDGKIVYTLNYGPAGKITGTTEQNAGKASSTVKAEPSLGYKFVRWSDGKESAERSGDVDAGVYTAIFDYDVLDMPIVLVDMDSGKSITSKTEYAYGGISLLGCEEDYKLDDVDMKIRGRGNNSWGYPKKSYKFKLDKKENLFGLASGKQKVWVLLANQCDQSLQRNHVAFELGRFFEGLEWMPGSVSVDLYINGEYVGVYLLAEDIKVSGNRVDIYDENRDEVDIGYLLELSNYAEGDVISAGWRSYMIHSDLSEANSIKKKQMSFIQDYVNDCFNALLNGDEEKCDKLIDLDSLVAAYLVEETTKNLDSQWDSFYLYKDKGGKLFFGPLWDFDLSLGNANEGEETISDIFVGSGRGSGGGQTTWFALAMQHEWFRQRVADVWKATYSSIATIPQYILDEGQLGLRSYDRNFVKWKIFGTTQNRETRNITSLKTYTEHYEYLAQWATERIAWLNDVFTNETFVSEGYGLKLQNNGWGNWGGNQGGSSYGNDETKELADKYESLTDLINQKSVEGPDGNSGEGVENLFDNNKDTKYCLTVDGEITVTFKTKKDCTVSAYLMRTGNDTSSYPERNPDSWSFYGSSDGAYWTLITEEADGGAAMGTDDKTWYGFEVANPAPYKFYKMVFNENGIIQLSEIRLLG